LVRQLALTTVHTKVDEGAATLANEERKTLTVEGLERFVDEKFLAELFGVSTGYLANLRSSGGGPKYYTLGKAGRGRCIRYRLTDALAWAESRSAASTSQYARKA
jgi:hypothetical protein